MCELKAKNSSRSLKYIIIHFNLNNFFIFLEENEYHRIRKSIVLPFDSKSIEEFNAYSRSLPDDNNSELNDEGNPDSEFNKSSKFIKSSKKSQKSNKQDINSSNNGYNQLNSLISGLYGGINKTNYINNNNGMNNNTRMINNNGTNSNNGMNNNNEMNNNNGIYGGFNRMQGIKNNNNQTYGMNSNSKNFGNGNNNFRSSNQNKFNYDENGYNNHDADDDDDENVNFANSLRVIKKNSSKSKKFTTKKTTAGDYSKGDVGKEEKEDVKIVNSLADDWLLKWSILNNKPFKKHEEIFSRFDVFSVGHISGPMLADAISSVYKLTNNQMNYLFNILNLCEIDPFVRGADLNMFKIITSLAEKITNLDDEWFFSLLPKLDISSVENKAFKIRSLWNYLVNAKTKMLTNQELMIEFEAGGVTKEHIDFARRKFSDKLYFEITDYITYIPLFLCIHSRIIKNPLGKYEAI